MVDIKCDGTSSSPTNGTGWMVVYGISGTHNDVPPSAVFDRRYVIENGALFMECNLDMNKNSLMNVASPNGDFQAANKKYVDKTASGARVMKE